MAKIINTASPLEAVTSLNDPFSADVTLAHGGKTTSLENTNYSADFGTEQIIDRAVESAVVRAIFNNNDSTRRRFMKRLGAAGAMAAISSIFPLDIAKSWANDTTGPLEKKSVLQGQAKVP